MKTTPHVLFLLLACLALTCNDNATDSSDPSGGHSRQLDGRYFHRGCRFRRCRPPNRLIAAGGGTVSVTDGDGVEMSLAIPPHSLPSDSAITLIPLSDLAVYAPIAPGCVDPYGRRVDVPARCNLQASWVVCLTPARL